MTDIQELKGQVDTAEFATRRWGVQFRGDGRGRRKACCPLHQEKEASFVVYPDGGWTCFGACNRSGDVFDLVMLRDNVDLGGALREVAAFAGVTLTPLTPQVRARVAARRALEEVLGVAVAHWEKRLWATPRAVDYCRWRGWDEETIRAHRLGYTDKTIQAGTWLSKAGIDPNSKAARAVLNMPKGMLVYPHIEMGRVMYVSGRLADTEMKGHYNPPSQLIGSRRAMWNAERGDDVVVVEGQADAVTLGQWGIPAVALAGCGLTATGGQALVKRLRRFEQVYVWPDADGRTDVAELALALGPMIRVIKGLEKDANAWLQAGGTAQAVARVMGEAMTWMDVLLGEAARDKGEATLKAVMVAFNALDVWGQAAWRRRVCRSLDLTVDEMRAMAKAVEAEAEAGPVQQNSYVARQGMFCRVVHNETGTQYRALGNFTARIVEDIVEDDGEETERRFVVEGKLASGKALPRVEVEAGEFSQMRWMAQLWGARAAVAAGTAARDHLRAGIQVLSTDVQTRHEFSHLGWREMDGSRFYLSAAGAVGRNGVQVRFIHDLVNYRLPTTPENTKAAMEASLMFLETGDFQVTVPLWSAMYLAPLASIIPPSFTLWLYGTTGTLKSTATALAMCHYGQFSYNTPPASWTGTTNALEKKAFLVKDAPLWIDDYTAQSTFKGMNEIRKKADQLLRDWGNRSGRSRMMSNLRLRRTFVPRGIIISTAEQLPPGQSILARLYAVEVHPDMMTRGAGSPLTLAQVEQCGFYPHAMGGYLLWLADRWSQLEEVLREDRLKYTEAARAEGGEHLRMPGNVATMFLGWKTVLGYAEEIGALGKARAEELREVGWWVLLGIGERQHQIVIEERPVEMYLDALQQMMAMGSIYLRHKDFPEDGEKVKSRQKTLTAEFVGWYDDNFWYLLPKVAFNAVVRFYRAGGTVFPDSERGVRVKLHEEGRLVPQANRLASQLRIGGERHWVLRIGSPEKSEVIENSGDTDDSEDSEDRQGKIPF